MRRSEGYGRTRIPRPRAPRPSRLRIAGPGRGAGGGEGAAWLAGVPRGLARERAGSEPALPPAEGRALSLATRSLRTPTYPGDAGEQGVFCSLKKPVFLRRRAPEASPADGARGRSCRVHDGARARGRPPRQPPSTTHMALSPGCHGAEEGGRRRWREFRGLVAPHPPHVPPACRLPAALCEAEKIFTTFSQELSERIR